VVSLFKTVCFLKNKVVFLDRATELKLSTIRWKLLHFFRGNEKLLPKKGYPPCSCC
jgi:hypothetical protein